MSLGHTYCLFLIVFSFSIPIEMVGQKKNDFLYPQDKYSTLSYLTDTLNKRTFIEGVFIRGIQYNVESDTVNHPYYNAYKWTHGTIKSMGMIYHANSLMYDIEVDKLIYYGSVDTLGYYSVALDVTSVDEFSLNDSHFKYIEKQKQNNGSDLKRGYYEIVYEGKKLVSLFGMKRKSN